MTTVTLHALNKTFPPRTTAVAEVSAEIGAGEILCLLGPSGCGKTTLLRLIAGLEQADSGEVRVDGIMVDGVPPHQRDFGMMFQDFALFPHKNVADNVAFGLQMRRQGKDRIQRRVAEMLALVDLAGLEQRGIDALSGGEQQRVALARALAPGPRLLLLDEPLGALDRALRERLMLEVRAILKAVGVTAVYVTHDQTEAYAVGDAIAVMNAGRLEQVARPEVVYRQPATPFVARFLGLHNLIPGRKTPNGVETLLGHFPVAAATASAGAAPGAPVTLLIRPDAVSGQEPSLAEIQGRVARVTFRGRFYQLWLETPSGHRLLFELPDVAGMAVDQTITLPLAADGLQLLPAAE